MNRWLALCLALLLILSLFGCKKGEHDDPDDPAPAAPVVAEGRTITLAYDATSPLNPYQTDVRINVELSTLLFEPLFRLDAAFAAQPVLASSITNDGVRVAVTLRDDVRFSNGEVLTAHDVAYSFGYAKESAYYGARLSNFFSCTVEETAAVFTLLSPNVDCASCLDFPIMKFGTATNDVPIGCGRYILRFKDGAPVLQVNPDPAVAAQTLPSLQLYDVSHSENLPYLLQIGEVSFLSSDPLEQSGEKISAQEVRLPMNHLIFLGFNTADGALADPALRCAVCAALDRSALTNAAFGPDATVTTAPFNPAWGKLPAAEPNTQSASDLLDAAGYLLPNLGAATRQKDGETPSLTLIVGEGNSARTVLAEGIQTALRAAGLSVTVETVPTEDYRGRLQRGEFSMYLGEVKLPGDMDLSAFFSDAGFARYGLSGMTTVKGAYANYRSGAIDLPTFLKVFDEQAPFVPLCCRNLVFYYTRALSTAGTPGVSAPFAGIETWRLA